MSENPGPPRFREADWFFWNWINLLWEWLDTYLYQRYVVTTDVSTSPYTTTDADAYIMVDTSGGAVTLNLQAGIVGRHFNIKNTSTNNVTITPNGAETIEGAGTYVLGANLAVDIVYNSEWKTV